jgi:hypothetical protein
MPQASRRALLKAGMAAGLGAWLVSRPQDAVSALHADASAGQEPRVPLIHVTDLFHPHGDPDDHFDLASVYALAMQGRFDLRGIVIDGPPEFRAGDPAVVAVAQMNHLAGLTVPVAIGTSKTMAGRADALPDASWRDTAAIRFIIECLRASERPVALTCVGSAADIVIAALREPALFRDKCAGVYLNSGSAHDNPARPAQLEFNVALDPAAYAAMFDLPCPLTWFPCWHVTEVRESGESGSFYWLPHRDALAGISDAAANFFAYMFGKSTEPKWLRAMNSPPPADAWEKILSGRRGMWSTASLLAATGLTVTRDGDIVPSAEAGDSAVFRLKQVEVTCADDGQTTWQDRALPSPSAAGGASKRWMLSVCDVTRYPVAMTRAVRTLFKTLE